MKNAMTRWMALGGLIFAMFVLSAGCRGLPRSGDPCSGPVDNVCESSSGPGLWTCPSDTRRYEYRDCQDICVSARGSNFTGRCGTGSDGWDVCFCSS